MNELTERVDFVQTFTLYLLFHFNCLHKFMFEFSKSGIMIDESKIVRDVNGFTVLDSLFAAAYIPGGPFYLFYV